MRCEFTTIFDCSDFSFFFPIILKKKNNFRKNFDTYIYISPENSVVGVIGYTLTFWYWRHRTPNRRESLASIATHFRAKPNRASRWSHFQNEIPTPVFYFNLICEQRFAWKQDYVTTLYYSRPRSLSALFLYRPITPITIYVKPPSSP